MVAQRAIEKAESPIRHIHPVMVREGDPPGPSPFSSREKRPPEGGRNSSFVLYSISPITLLMLAIGCQVDVVSENGINPRIRERVLKEAVPL